jgi:hypothetical protein
MPRSCRSHGGVRASNSWRSPIARTLRSSTVLPGILTSGFRPRRRRQEPACSQKLSIDFVQLARAKSLVARRSGKKGQFSEVSKGVVQNDISEFESFHPSQPVRSRTALDRKPMMATHEGRAGRCTGPSFAPAGRVLRYLPMILISTRLRRPPSNSHIPRRWRDISSSPGFPTLLSNSTPVKTRAGRRPGTRCARGHQKAEPE